MKLVGALPLSLLMLAALASGCSGEDRSAVAAAKCSSPVAERLGVPDGERLERTSVEVQALGKGRYRVIGIALAGVDGLPTVKRDGRVFGTAFLCEVAPDSTDRLRGFQVTRLQVGGASN